MERFIVSGIRVTVHRPEKSWIDVAAEAKRVAMSPPAKDSPSRGSASSLAGQREVSAMVAR